MSTYGIDEFPFGSKPVVIGSFTEVGQPALKATPTAVTVVVRTPAGAETTYSSPHATITLGSTTTFTFPAACLEAGTWTVRMKATAGTISAREKTFTILASAFTSP